MQTTKNTPSTADLIRSGMHPSEAISIDRDDAIALIREALKQRSGKSWSVTGDRGTAWGWITIQAPPARRVAHDVNPADRNAYIENADAPKDRRWYTSDAECAELAELLGLAVRQVSAQGVTIPADSSYRREYVARARGLEPISHGIRYWD